MMSPLPEFENCTVVLLGSFNPAIFHPEWFVRQGLLADDAVDSDKIKVVSPEVTECMVGAVRVFCDTTRLVFSVGNMVDAGKLQDVVAGTLRILAHVPLGALGINQEGVFKAQSEDHWHKIGHTLAPKDPVWNKLGPSPGMLRVSIKFPVQEDPKVEENITVEPCLQSSPRHPGIKISTNLHYQLSPPSELSTSGETSKQALEFIASRWKAATHKVREVAAVIFEEIKP